MVTTIKITCDGVFIQSYLTTNNQNHNNNSNISINNSSSSSTASSSPPSSLQNHQISNYYNTAINKNCYNHKINNNIHIVSTEEIITQQKTLKQRNCEKYKFENNFNSSSTLIKNHRVKLHDDSSYRNDIDDYSNDEKVNSNYSDIYENFNNNNNSKQIIDNNNKCGVCVESEKNKFDSNNHDRNKINDDKLIEVEKNARSKSKNKSISSGTSGGDNYNNKNKLSYDDECDNIDCNQTIKKTSSTPQASQHNIG